MFRRDNAMMELFSDSVEWRMPDAMAEQQKNMGTLEDKIT
jgi:hypothetical protein